MSESPPTPQPQNVFPPWLTLGKVFPPTQRIDALERMPLLKLLEQSRGGKLTLIDAPAGYGKSTLVAGWKQRLNETGVVVCWYSLDCEDNEPLQLLTYLAFSLAQRDILLTPLESIGNPFGGNYSPVQLLNLIIGAIALFGGPVMLILDDFENLEASTVQEVIAPLLRYAPDNLHVCILTRNQSHLNISQMEANGLVCRLSAQSLQFTLQELESIFEGQLTSSVIRQVYSLTEGWPVAVQMLRTALLSERDQGKVLLKLHDQAGTIANYLSEQVLSTLGENQQQFLMDLSLQERIDCGFADFLRQANDSLQQIHSLETMQALIRPIDTLSTTYQLHPLLREYLYRRLQMTAPDRLYALHARTAQWFQQQGDLVNAVRHCVLANRQQEAIAIIEQMGAISLWLREGLTRLRTALEMLDESVVRSSSRLLLLRCIIDVKNGKVHRASLTLEAAKQRTEFERQQGMPAARQAELDYELSVVDVLLAIYAGKRVNKASYQQLVDSTHRIGHLEHEALGFHYTFLCLIDTHKGLFKSARDYARRSIRSFREINSLYGENYIHFHLGDISFAEGNSAEAEEHYRNGLDLARRKFSEDKGIKLAGYVLLLELLYELDREDYSRSMVQSIPRELEEREAWFDMYAAGYSTCSNLEFERSGIDATLRILTRADKYAEQQKLDRLRDLLIWQRIDLLVRASRLSEARKVLDSAGVSLADYRSSLGQEAAWRERDSAAHSISRLLIREGSHQQALKELEYFSGQARSHGHVRSIIRYALLQAQAAHGIKDLELARSSLEEALELSLASGFVRSFIDEGLAVQALLRDYTAVDNGPARSQLCDYADDLLVKFDQPKTPPTPDNPLTERERQILGQLTLGLSNKQIARELELSENTVRFHLKNIFAKLSVNNRLLAVEQAKIRGWIPGSEVNR